MVRDDKNPQGLSELSGDRPGIRSRATASPTLALPRSSRVAGADVAEEPKGDTHYRSGEDYVYGSLPAGLGQTLAHPPSASRRVGGTVPNQRESRSARRRAAPAPARTTTPAAQH
jgi:hypothetical protein